MISLAFNLRNPWSTRFENLWNRSYATPFANKFVELEVTKDSTLVSVQFDWTVRQSHSGVGIELGVFGYCVGFKFYDSRHWDSEWETYEKNLL